MTAPTATITGPLSYPGNSTKVAERTVTFACVGPDGVVLRDSDGGVVGATPKFTDTAGAFTQVLTLNSDIDEASGVGPPGTYWTASVGVRPKVVWAFRLDAADSGGTFVIGDKTLTVTDPTPRGWTPIAGIAGAPGAIAASVAASRPAASAVPSGAIFRATDTGELWQSDGSSYTLINAPQVAHKWVQDGTSGFTQRLINVSDTGSDATPGVLSVVAGRGRVTRTAATGNQRESWIRSGTYWADSEIRSLWYGPPTWASPSGVAQIGHIHRAQDLAAGGGLRAVVITQNIALGLINQINLAVWNAGGSPQTLTAIDNKDIKITGAPILYSPQIYATQRLQVSTVWTNRYWVLDRYRYAVGDKVNIAGCADATFNSAAGTWTISAVDTGPVGTGPTYIDVTGTATASTSAKAAAFGNMQAPFGAATTPKVVSPFYVASRVVGTDAWVKVWRTVDGEPGWDDPTHACHLDFSGVLLDSATSAVMEAPTGAGMCGIVSDHLQSGAMLEWGDVTFTRL